MKDESKELLINEEKSVSTIAEYAYVIEKSNPFVFLCFEGWTLLEVNLFELYLSKINPRDINSGDVIIYKKDIEKLTQVKRIRNEVFLKTCENLRKKDAKIYYHKYRNLELSLFDGKAIDRDKNGDLFVCFSCSAKAKKYLFNIENVGYIRYKLKEALLLPTVYSKILYYVFLAKHFLGEWAVTEEELREILGCMNKHKGREFIREIIKPSLEYINTYTELDITFSKVVGERNKTLHFVFKIDIKASYKRIIKINKEQYIESDVIKENIINLLTDTLRVSRDNAKKIILKADEKNVNTDELRELIKYINTKIENGKKINNKTSYILSLLDNEVDVNSTDNKKDNRFNINSFPQKNTDKELDELEILFLKEVNEPINKNDDSE